MEFSVKSGSPEKQRSACIVVGVFEPRRLSPVAEQLDKISDGYISSLLRRGDLEGKPGQMLLLHQVPGVLSERVLLVGCGKERELGERQYKEIIQKYLKRYKPDYGAFAVMNADTGELLAIESFVKDEENFNMGNLAIRSPFPAASISKIITAAAAIDEGKAYAETIIPYNGKRSTLYKRNVNSEKVNKWTRHVTLRQAFAQSINTVFGKLGAFHLGGTDLLKYAENFMFNKNVETDLLIEKSRFILDPSNRWDIVESAAGFTHRTMMSPVHGAMIASAILNEGEMKIPYVIRDIRDEDGIYVYQGRPKEPHTVLVPYSARQMKLLMEETVLHGTSRKYFKGFARQFDEVEFGGKTGSLDGKNVKGRTDWFVGYAAHDDLRLSIGVVTVHDKYWTVKSSYLARVFFEDVFRQQSKLTRELEKKKAQKHAKANP